MEEGVQAAEEADLMRKSCLSEFGCREFLLSVGFAPDSVIPGEQNGKGKDWSGQDLSQEAEYVCLRRYPTAPNRTMNDLPFAKRIRYVHLPMEQVWAVPGPSVSFREIIPELVDKIL